MYTLGGVKLACKDPSFAQSYHFYKIDVATSVPTDRRSIRTGPKIDGSVQDFKIAKRTSKDLFFDPGTMNRFFKMDSLEF